MESEVERRSFRGRAASHISQTFVVVILLGVIIVALTACAGDPLVGAAARGDVATVRALLAAGADVNAKSAEGDTALMGAAVKGHTETVKALLLIPV